ncbi:MAG: FAD-dependent oxidoreductase, partial [Chloroflexi bacterium]
MDRPAGRDDHVDFTGVDFLHFRAKTGDRKFFILWCKRITAMQNKHWNVIVCGGGLSGVCAAVAAARNGASTLLVERDASLGGTMTNSLVGPMMTFHSPERQVIAGLAQEIIDRLKAMNASPGHILDASDYCYTITPFDAEALKIVCQRMVLEAGAQILYHSLVTGVIKEGDRVTGIQVTHKAGTETLSADVVIDASGDGDVAALAGAPFEFGRPSDGRVQPISLMFKITNVDNAALRAYTVAHPEEVRRTEKQLQTYAAQPLNINAGFAEKLRAYIEKNNVPLQREGLLFFNTVYEDEFIVNTSRVSGVNPLDPWALSEAENVAREQVFALFDFFKKEIPGFANARLVSVGARLGIRESRRVTGEYVLTGEDIMAQRRFPDDVVTCAYP